MAERHVRQGEGHVEPVESRMADIHRCSICTAPAIVSTEDDFGDDIWLCANHLPEESREIYDKLRAKGWDAPAPETIQ